MENGQGAYQNEIFLIKVTTAIITETAAYADSMEKRFLLNPGKRK